MTPHSASTSSEPYAPEPDAPPMSFADRLLREHLQSRLGGLRGGSLTIEDAMGPMRAGVSGAGVSGSAQSHSPAHAHPYHHHQARPVHVRVRNPAFYRALAGSGSVGGGEAYGDGHWECDDLVGLIRLLVRNREWLDSMETGSARLGGLAMRALHALRRNTRAGSRRNIAAHYDLGNAFFQLFLSDDMMYSSAMWDGEDDTLEQASTRKLDVICRKLNLQPGDHVVEIGTGWGGFALHAARHYGCRVTTTTISREQHALASERIRRAGLQFRVDVLLQDYRDLHGQFDKLVSIEMIEAIGAAYLPTYFAKVGELLKPEGVALIQAITIEDHRYAQALKAVDFIKLHVFPGSFMPSIQAMLNAKTRASDLSLVHLEDFGLSYARTLQAWRQRFVARLDAVRAQGFDERFIRLWEFYLAYCEGGFRERAIGVSHLLLARPAAMPGAPRWTAREAKEFP
ncbi:class I SAM-dependent methyltransferase [Achromobacter sp. NPDC008082]|uniref:class I SAM-dependent methyltransferase n=1 Tax=Achromobacter sp. NPDC008082 TaxID=3363888 RepID=UPI0036EB9E8A